MVNDMERNIQKYLSMSCVTVWPFAHASSESLAKNTLHKISTIHFAQVELEGCGGKL